MESQDETIKETYKILHGAWWNMVYRCTNEDNKWYKDYGGRGIKLDSDWNAFENFYKWAVESGHKKGLTLERIDNNGDYEPSNCKWATTKEQGNNRRHVHAVTINGETKNVYEWSEVYNINYRTVITRYSTYGWDMIKAITTPTKVRKNPTGFKKAVRYE